jgi:hypothetical protein
MGVKNGKNSSDHRFRCAVRLLYEIIDQRNRGATRENGDDDGGSDQPPDKKLRYAQNDREERRPIWMKRTPEVTGCKVLGKTDVIDLVATGYQLIAKHYKDQDS